MGKLTRDYFLTDAVKSGYRPPLCSKESGCDYRVSLETSSLSELQRNVYLTLDQQRKRTEKYINPQFKARALELKR